MVEKFSKKSMGNLPIVLSDLGAALPRIYDKCPDDILVIVSAAYKELNPETDNVAVRFDEVHNPDFDKKVADGFQAIYPKISQFPEVRQATQNILSEYAKLPVTSDIRLKVSEDDNSIKSAVFAGLVIGSLVVGAYCMYLAAKG